MTSDKKHQGRSDGTITVRQRQKQETFFVFECGRFYSNARKDRSIYHHKTNIFISCQYLCKRLLEWPIKAGKQLAFLM